MKEKKIVLSALVKYWCILPYHKCELKYNETRVMKVILIRVIKEKIINIVLKSEMTYLFWDTIFFANGLVIIERRE